MARWYRENLEREREKRRQWREDNPEYQTRYYEENREEILEQQGEKYHGDHAYRVRKLRQDREYRTGISHIEFVQMVFHQEGSCAICSSKEPGGKGSWHVDHCHDTGEVRGLLCHSCNTGIGLLQEDPAILDAAIDYLQAKAKPRHDTAEKNS